MHWTWNITGTEILLALVLVNLIVIGRRVSLAHKRIDVMRKQLGLDVPAQAQGNMTRGMSENGIG